METQIISYTKISGNKIVANGRTLYEEPGAESPALFFSSAYKYLQLSYPKFFKMDNLCKLGFLAAETTIKNSLEWSAQDLASSALVFANNSSSLDTDRNHAATIADKKNYFPSPSVFVYTLPNIVTGEIAIRHKITGENAFFISEKFDPVLLHDYTGILLDGNTSQALCGWVNADEGRYEAFVYCVKKTTFKEVKDSMPMPHSVDQILELYNS